MTEKSGGRAVVQDAHGVSDEVWQVIAPQAALAAAGERRAVVKVAAVVAALAVGTTGLLLSGLVTARLSGGDNAGGGGGGQGDPYFVDFTLHNDGVTTVELVRWESRLDGVEVVGSSPADLRLAPRGTQEVKITFRTTDCATAVPAARAALRKSPLSGAGLSAVVDRPWGDMEAAVFPIMSMEDLVLSSCGQPSDSFPDSEPLPGS